jgi:hypothetical protein
MTEPTSWSSGPGEQLQNTAVTRIPDSLIDPRAAVSGGATWARTAARGAPSAGAAARHTEESPASRGGPEGRFLAGRGKAEYRNIMELEDQQATAEISSASAGAAAERAERARAQHEEEHRGGNLPWFLRAVVPVASVTEAVTAYVAMEALVPTIFLAEALSVLVALVGTGTACILANRRLNRLPVPVAARVLEGIFVAALTVLRYESLRLQGAGAGTAAGAAALAALLSSLGLLGIEEIVVETRTFAMFVIALWASWRQSRSTAAAARLARIRARVRTAADRLGKHFLEFLLKAEGTPLEEARRRAAALRTALTDREA